MEIPADWIMVSYKDQSDGSMVIIELPLGGLVSLEQETDENIFSTSTKTFGRITLTIESGSSIDGTLMRVLK